MSYTSKIISVIMALIMLVSPAALAFGDYSGMFDSDYGGMMDWYDDQLSDYMSGAMSDDELLDLYSNFLGEDYWGFLYDYLLGADWDFLPYAWTYGWCLSNNPESYGFDDDTKIPMSVYFDTYGYKGSALFESVIGGFSSPADGVCFGLCLTSLAEYYGLYDVSQHFDGYGYLYDYGYDSIYTRDDGKQCFSIAGNTGAINMLFRAMVAQTSLEIDACEVFAYDNDYEELIEFMSGYDARPLLVNLDYADFDWTQGFRHTVILSNDYPPIPFADGWYWLPIYDPNSPMPSLILDDPLSFYERGISGLLLNPDTTEWALYFMGDIYKSTTNHALANFGTANLTGKTIRFYDISRLSPEHFTERLHARGDGKCIVWVDGNAKVRTFDIKGPGDVIFEIQDGVIKHVKDGLLPRILAGDGSGSDIVVVLELDPSQIEITSDSNASVIIMNEDNFMAANVDSTYAARMDMANGTAAAECFTGGGNVAICVQDAATGNTTAADAPSAAGESIVISSEQVLSGTGGLNSAAQTERGGVITIAQQAPAAMPTPVPTPEPTPVPTAEPTPVPTAEPTPMPTTEPTPVPTAEPTPVPTAEPTPVPTAEPVYTPAAVITSEPIAGAPAPEVTAVSWPAAAETAVQTAAAAPAEYAHGGAAGMPTADAADMPVDGALASATPTIAPVHEDSDTFIIVILAVIGVIIVLCVVLLVVLLKPAKARKTAKPAKAAPPKVRAAFCPGCGSPLIDGQKFCARCGRKLI